MNRYSISILFSILFTVNFTWAMKLHIRPISYIPDNLKPYEAHDVVSYNITRQIHRGLFRINFKNIPVPDVVEDFDVDESQLVYTFYIKELDYHSGKKLEVKDVLITIENALKMKINDYRKLFIIQGAEEFSEHKKEIISGISLDEAKRSIRVKLTRPEPKFLYHLADPRLSIINLLDSKDGLGFYKLHKIKKNEISLVITEKNNSNPDTVIFRQMNRGNALKAFKEKKVDDLALYSLDKKELNKIRANAKISKYYFPRTYALFINSRKIIKDQRDTIIKSVDWSQFRKQCFSEKEKALSVIPPGFIGYSSEKPTVSRVDEAKKKCDEDNQKHFLFIPKGLGFERCALNFFTKYKKCQIVPKIVSFPDVIQGWNDGSLSMYLGYVEAENAVDYYGHFVPESSFPLGEVKDTIMLKLYNEFNQTKNYVMKEKIAKKIGRYLLDLNTIVPLFYENLNLVVSKKYKSIEMGVRSVSMIPFKEFVYESQK